MPDFSSLLKAPAGEAKKPKVLVIGNYPGIVKSFELMQAPQGKDYSMIVRVHVGLTGWCDNASEEDKQQEIRPGEFRPIDLSKRQLRKDFYDNSLYRLDDLIKSCGITPDGKTYEETLPQLVGAQLVVEVEQYLNQNTNDLGNQIKNIVGAQ